MTKTPIAVLFDADGTLFDTEYIFQAFEYATVRQGVHLPREVFRKNMGQLLPDIYRIIAPQLGVDALVADHKRFQKEHCRLAKLFPHVRDTLERLENVGCQLAIISTRYKESVHDTLACNDIANFFGAVIAGDEVKNTKPDPEPLVRALAALGADANAAFMVGDTWHDIRAGKNAGTRTIAVTYGFHGAAVADEKPDYLVDRIDEIIPIVLNEKT